mmetsp:Transcript_24518/g.79255  ORF Transcript_24518/g.79255 Transcript_24518/m.79255 type:complete len:112 (+) Transcript_24518:49-384(+)
MMRYMQSQKTMEINPRHPVIAELNAVVAASKEDDATNDLAWLLLDNALMQSGFTPHDITAFNDRILRQFKSGLSLASLDLNPEIEVSLDEEDESEDGEEVDLDDFDDKEEL